MGIQISQDVNIDDAPDALVAETNDDLFSDFRMLNAARRQANNKPTLVSVDIGAEKAQRGVQREFSAYDVWDYHTSAEADMKWEMDKRKRAFEAKMKQWKRVLEMKESGELQ